MPSETSVAICSMLFGGVLEKFPKLKVCFAHGGKTTKFVLVLSYLNKMIKFSSLAVGCTFSLAVSD